jgi:hypothetical protein
LFSKSFSEKGAKCFVDHESNAVERQNSNQVYLESAVETKEAFFLVDLPDEVYDAYSLER